uniref:Phosphoglycerate mutase n=1 Tax=Pseudictyota dubia TaxID=2749911 RepID=A0A7R9ZCF0_9STRA
MIPITSLSRFSSVAFGILSSKNDPISLTAFRHSNYAQSMDRASDFLSALPPLCPGRKRVYLIRHGQTDWNAQGLMQGGGYDIPLNEYGLAQARHVAEALGGIELDVVASSHLSRASQTADEVHAIQRRNCRARSLSAAVSPPSRVVMTDFGEMRFGELEGSAKGGGIREARSVSQSAERLERCNKAMAEDGHWSWPGPDGESAYQVEERALHGLEELLGNGSDGDRHVAIVSHSRTNKVLLASLLRGDATEFSSIEQGNTCINVFDWDEDEGKVHGVIVNYLDHAVINDMHP